MKKNGFVLVETIVAIVVLTSSLLFLYTTFFNILQAEKARVYYDDINYLYRANYIKKELYQENFKTYLDNIDRNQYLYNIQGSNISEAKITLADHSNLDLIKGADKEFLTNLLATLEAKNLYIIPRLKIDNLKTCDNKCAFGKDNCNGDGNLANSCQLLFGTTDGDLVTYLKTIDISSTDSPFIMVMEFHSCDKNNNCRNYYSWVGVSNE